MSPTVIPLALQGVTSLAQIAGGAIGGRNARNEYENAEVPNYFDTAAYQTAESSANQAYRYAQEGLPEASRRMQEDLIGRSGAASLASQGSLRSGIAGVGQTAQSMSDSYRQLSSMDAQQRIANRGQYFNQLGNLQNAQNVQADREYGQFLNQQAGRLSRMTANRNTMNQGIQGISQAGTLAFQAALTPEMYGGFLKDKSGGGGQKAANGGMNNGFPINPNPFSMSFMNPAFAAVTAPQNPWD
jgi:hypothetical protein